ncbi:MAG: TonB-dependent receptor, partial [Balneolales bacterium]|nr:TonB-dependent receptor [Balneolales bacterium]
MKTLLITWLTLHYLTSFTISGTVHDASNNQPLPYTHITVFDENRQYMITGGVSDLDGHFSIVVDASSVSSLRISAIGYETLWLNVDPENTTFNSISLTPISIVGDEVVILARPLPAIIRADHIRYYPASEQLLAASSALEVLRFLPGVQVDLFQQVSLDGQSDVLILVDGMQRDRQYLQQIPPSRIERIEVLPMPPAAYQATSSGAINIILRPLPDYHLGMRAHAEAPTRRNEQFLFPNASISYNKRAFLLNTSYAGERTQFNIRENQEV